MKLIELLAALSLYPWNLGVGGYYTYATFRDNMEYRGQTAVVSLDRKNKDLLLFKLEHYTIDGGNDQFEQFNYIARGEWWADSRFRPGIFAWFPRNDMTESNEYYLGGTLAGDFDFGGYQLSLIRKNGAEPGPYNRNRQNNMYKSYQYDVSFHKWFGPHRIRAGITVADQLGKTYFLYRFGTLSTVSRRITIFLNYATGESRYNVQPFDVSVHDSQDILKAEYVAGATLRISPNLYTYISYIRLDMEAVFPQFQWPETKQYYTAGLKVRL